MAEGINHLLNLSHHCMPLDTMQTGFFLDSSGWVPGVKVKVVVLSLLSYDGIRFFFFAVLTYFKFMSIEVQTFRRDICIIIHINCKTLSLALHW